MARTHNPPCANRLGVRTKIRGREARSMAPRALPPREGSQTPLGERRHLTVMFCDLVASSALAEELDPEDFRDVLAGYHRTCSAVIAEFDGYVAQLLGDGVLAYFSYPKAHEDDAERALRAGLRVIAAIEEEN